MNRQFDKYTNYKNNLNSYVYKDCNVATYDKKDLYELLYPNNNEKCKNDSCHEAQNRKKYYDSSTKKPMCEIPKDDFIINPNCINTYEYYNYSYGLEEVDVSTGGYLELSLKSEDCEVRGDVVLKNDLSFILWGEIRDKCNKPVSDLLVTLMKPIYIRGVCKYIAEANTKTNSIGFYQFNISKENKNLNYKILLGSTV